MGDNLEDSNHEIWVIIVPRGALWGGWLEFSRQVEVDDTTPNAS